MPDNRLSLTFLLNPNRQAAVDGQTTENVTPTAVTRRYWQRDRNLDALQDNERTQHPSDGFDAPHADVSPPNSKRRKLVPVAPSTRYWLPSPSDMQTDELSQMLAAKSGTIPPIPTEAHGKWAQSGAHVGDATSEPEGPTASQLPSPEAHLSALEAVPRLGASTIASSVAYVGGQKSPFALGQIDVTELHRYIPELVRAGWPEQPMRQIAKRSAAAPDLEQLAHRTAVAKRQGIYPSDFARVNYSEQTHHTLARFTASDPNHTSEAWSCEDLIDMVRLVGSADALAVVTRHAWTLHKEKLDLVAVVLLAGNVGGDQTIFNIVFHLHALRRSGFTNDDILRVAGFEGGAKSLETLRLDRGQLKRFGFSKADLVDIAANPNSFEKIRILVEQTESLLAVNTPIFEIVSVAANRRMSPENFRGWIKWNINRRICVAAAEARGKRY